ncbi:HAD-IA family hydrolase [Streptomyces sp. NPDC056600]|uniref:HAD-IA family hydrolase n=1 Tax=Streptomyces sp. NPDC056600 TaxID=3345874 RepID=UPI0036C5F7BA
MSTTSSRPRPFDAVLCDLDGVVRHWPPADTLELANGLPVGALAAAAFAPARLHPAVTGEVTDEQWRAAVTDDLAARHGSRRGAEAMVADWSAVLPVVDEDVVALLRQVREVAAVALVTNATTRLERDLERQGLDDLADLVVNTARIGVAKPDPRVVRHAAERLGVPVGRCLFVDDTEANVLAARETGMTALHHRRVADLRTALAPLLGVGGAA